jgi:hypothetical protein
VPETVREVLRAPGQPLDNTTREFMEPRFGFDFSKVRIHTDAKAAASADGVNALAYTVRRNIVFSAGRFRPETGEGRQLLGHELANVIQQESNAASTPEAALSVGGADTPEEAQAHAIAGDIMASPVARPSLAQVRSTRVLSSLFGKLPSDVPYSATCSALGILAAALPFTGDFGKVADRVSYGDLRCCTF